MPHVLQPATMDVIARLKDASRLPVTVTGLGGLGALATVRIARGAAAVHHVLYDPLADAPADYVVAHRCGVALRLYSLPPDQRFELAPADAGREAVARDLAAPGGVRDRYRLDDERLASLRDKLYGGLMVQLQTVPVGLRVDRWLWTDLPELREVQTESTRALLAENAEVLAPDVRAMTPPRSHAASVAMNAATAAFWSRTWADPSVVRRFLAAGCHREGLALLRQWDLLPDEPASDRALIDAWAAHLGLDGWYEWRPFPTPGAPANAA